MKNKFILGLVTTCAIACTIIIYLLIFEEYSLLFYINVITACIAEILLLTNIPLLSSKRLLTYSNASSSIIINAYAILLFLWISISTFLVEEDNYKIIYIGGLILTILLICLLGSIRISRNSIEKEEANNHSCLQSRKTFLFSLEDYWGSITNTVTMLPIDSTWKTHNLQVLKIALDKLSSIPSHKIENLHITEINCQLKEIKELFDKLSDYEQQNVQLQITQKINQLKNHITTIKSSI